MRGILVWVVLAWGLLAAPVAMAQVDDDEIVVYGDRFKRWDKTRWSILTEVMLTEPLLLAMANDFEMRASAYQLRVVLTCEKDWKISRGKWEVLCEIEDLGLQVAGWKDDAKRLEINAKVLGQIHGRMKGAALQLQVTKDGRVSNVQMEGEGAKSNNSKERGIVETCRQLLLRMVAGFDMKLRKTNFLKTGQWVEYRSPLFDMPGTTRSNMSSALVVHQLDPYKGHIVVQSVGKGSVVPDTGTEIADMSRSYAMNMEGVSIYQEAGGFMTDRVWYVTGSPTGNFWSSSRYFSAGRLEMLGPDQKIDVGPTRQVRLPKQKTEDVPDWVSIEDAGDWQRPTVPNLPARK